MITEDLNKPLKQFCIAKELISNKIIFINS